MEIIEMYLAVFMKMEVGACKRTKMADYSFYKHCLICSDSKVDSLLVLENFSVHLYTLVRI